MLIVVRFSRLLHVQVIVLETKAWSPSETELLCTGIEKHGIGSWKDIRREYLNKWDEQSIRIKATKLIGCQNLKRYEGWKGTKEEIRSEKEKNRALGESIGCWKGGCLVEDLQGSVSKALRQRSDRR